MIWFYSVLVLLFAVGVGIWFLHRFYAKATPETALVRTGFGGRRVVLDGGCLALPILHQVQRVSMQAISLPVTRAGASALLTEDQMRADVAMEFELRVAPTVDGVGTAAQALGTRIVRGSAEAVGEVLRGALVGAMQDAAAHRKLEQIHLDRAGFTAEVAAAVAEPAGRLGLMLVSASLVGVDQSDLRQFDETNAFNAQGMRRLAEMVAVERKARIKVETEAEVAVREAQLAQHQRQLELKRAEREAEIAQDEHLKRLEAEARARSDRVASEAALNADTARIETQQRAKTAQVENDRALRRAEMAAILALEEEKIAHAIQLAEARIAEAKTKAAEEESKAQVMLAAEKVQIAKERAVAEREREVAALRQKKDLDLQDARVKSDVETMLARASADAAVAKTAAEAEQARMEAEAAGRSALNEAENRLSEAVIRMRLEERKLDRLPEIMTQMMKPVEKIDSIRINQIGGLGSGGDGTGVDSAFGAAMDQILGMAVRLPAMKQMGDQIGLDFDPHNAARTADYANRIKAKDREKDKGGRDGDKDKD